MFYSAIFTVLYVANEVFGDGCKEMDFKITRHGYALVNHTFYSGQVTSDGHCESKCFNDDRCISYNFGRGTNGGLQQCELNDADHKQFPDDLVPRPDTIYRMAENTCNCTGNQVCSMDFVNKIHSCICRDPSKITPTCDVGYRMENCKSFSTRFDEMILDGSDPTQDEVCRTVLYKASDITVQPYRVSVEIQSYNIGGQGGRHPGIIFNVQNENNFHFVFFRPHALPNCVGGTVTQPGHVVAGITKFSPSTCSSYVPVSKWFKAEIQVSLGSVKVFLDDQYATTYSTSTVLTFTKRSGLMVYNGFKTIAKFRNYVIEDL